MGGSAAANNTLMILEAGDLVYGLWHSNGYWCANRIPTQDYDKTSCYVPVNYAEVVPYPPATAMDDGGGAAESQPLSTNPVPTPAAAVTSPSNKARPPPPPQMVRFVGKQSTVLIALLRFGFVCHSRLAATCLFQDNIEVLETFDSSSDDDDAAPPPPPKMVRCLWNSEWPPHELNKSVNCDVAFAFICCSGPN